MTVNLTPEQFQGLAKGEHPSLVNLVSTCTLITWDFLVTLSEEIRLVWRSKLSVITVVFLVMRYLALGTQFISVAILLSNTPAAHSTCKAYIWFRSFSSAILICASQIILIYRVLAVYNWNSMLQLLLWALFVATNVSILVFLIIGTSSYTIIPDPIPALNSVLGGCITFSYPKALSILWITELIFQSVLFIFMFSKFSSVYFNFRNAGIPKGQRQVSQIYTVFVRDGVWVYVVQLVSLLLCVIYNRHTSHLGIDFIFWQVTVSSICCTRLILNLRSLGPQGVETRVGDESIDLMPERQQQNVHVVETSETNTLTFTAQRFNSS